MFLLSGLGTSGLLGAQYGPVRIDVEPQPAMEGANRSEGRAGYIEYRISIENASRTNDYQVRLNQSDPYEFRGLDRLKSNIRTIQIPKGTKSVVSLFQPCLESTGSSLEVSINGVVQEERIALPQPFSGSGRYSSIPATGAVLASRGIPQQLKDEVRNASVDQISFYRSELETSGWSPNWLGYTAYDVVLMTAEEAGRLPADVVLAIRRYVENGGVCLIQSDSESNENLIPAGLQPASTSLPESGWIRLGLGIVGRCPESAPWHVEIWRTGQSLPVAPGDSLLRVDNASGVPVRALLALVILFAIGIGPLNIWWLSRKRKKMWLWWNVPLFSLMTCVLIFLYSLFSEGIIGRGRHAVFTLLDEQTHRANSLGYVSYYCPLAPSSGLRFSYDTSVLKLETSGRSSWDRRGTRPRTINWTTDQNLESGWVLPRIPACFLVSKNEPRRERLVFHKSAAGELSVVNGLGVTIDSLHYLDQDGQLCTATDVTDGAEKPLQKIEGTGESHEFAYDHLCHQLKSQFESRFLELKSRPENFLVPGSYVAVMKQNPFLENPLPGTPQTENIGIVYGIGAEISDGN